MLQRAPGGAVALLYPFDANAFAVPFGVVPLDSYQELPSIPVGDTVELEDPPVHGEKVTLRCRDGTEIAPSSPLEKPGDYAARLFAERDQTVVAHPSAVEGSRIWRQAQSRSPSSVAEWEDWLRRKHRGAVASCVVGVVIIIIAGVIVAGGGGPRLVATALTLVIAGAAGLVQAGRSRAALKAARNARRASPRPIQLRLWWSVGTGSGPTAIASIAPPGSSDPEREALHFEVVNVPLRLALSTWTQAEILGDALEGDSPIVRIGETELWPADTARRVLRKAWWHGWVND